MKKLIFAAVAALCLVSASFGWVFMFEYRDGVYFHKNKPNEPYSGEFFWSDDDVYYKGNMINGKLHGKWESDGCGEGRETGTYKDGKKHGEWKTEYSVENYKDGKPHGEWVSSYPKKPCKTTKTVN